MDNIDAGVCKDEADAIEEALNNKVDKGPWIDLFVSFSLLRSRSRILVNTNNYVLSLSRKEQTFAELQLQPWFLSSSNLPGRVLFHNVGCFLFMCGKQANKL